MKNRYNTKWLHLAALFTILLFWGSASGQDVDEEIVTWSLKKPDRVETGEAFDIEVQFSVKPDWYIYAPDGVNESLGMIETNVILNPGKLTPVGRMKFPKSVFRFGHQVYEGDTIVMRQTFKAASVKPGRYEINGKVIYQSCNSEMCLVPMSEKIVVVINVN